MSEFIWKGKVLDTLGQIMDTIADCETPEEARELVKAFCAKYANAQFQIQIGYCLYDMRTARRVRQWLNDGETAV